MLKEDQDVPNVDPFRLYIEAFHELSTCRYSSGFGETFIPFTAIVEYSKIYEVGDFDEFLYLIRQMDYEYVKLENNKQKQKPVKNNGTANTNKSNNSKNRHSRGR